MSVRLAAWLIATGLALLYWLIPNPLFEWAERNAYDLQMQAASTQAQETRLVLIDIDEKSLTELGPWPWPRETVAALVDTLTQHYRVNVAALDIVFPNPREGDAQLKAALSNPAVILSQTFDMSPGSTNRAGKVSGTVSGTAPVPDTVPQTNAHGFIANAETLLPPNPQVGHITPNIDADGKLRSLYPVICWQGECSIALGLRVFQKLMQAGSIRWQSKPAGASGYWSFDNWPDTRIPVDASGKLWVPFRVQPGGFQYVSATDVINKRTEKETLENTITLVGSTALGLGDRVSTPTAAVAPGLEVHAQLLAAILNRDLNHRAELSTTQALIAFAIAGVLILFWPAATAKAIAVFAVALATITAAAVYAVATQGYILLPASALFIWIAVASLSWLGLESARLNRQLQGLAKQFSAFLPKALVRKMLRNPNHALGAESNRQTLTVLVADLRGFTAACERKTPEQVASFAQKCLETLSAVVDTHGGTVEKFTGDGLMAIWGAPESDPDHAKKALKAGRDMQQAIQNLAPWFAENDLPTFQLSVGINSGEVAVGVFGSQAHLAWTAQGDAVNLAGRIEQLTRETGDTLLVGEITASLVGLSQFAPRGTHLVKGRTQPVQVFALR
jgi:adenylate cyclase